MRLPLPAFLAASLALPACVAPAPPPPDPTTPGAATYRLASDRISAVVISETSDLSRWLHSRLALRNAPEDADGGSAAPISPDGYFLTASHVLATAAGRNVFVIYGRNDDLQGAPARVVWQSAAADLALLKAPIATPRYYQWTPGNQWIPQGTPIIHAGIATGFESPPGELAHAVPPDSRFRRYQRFRHNVPLRPGDSGGAVLDARGRLIGINSAVEFLVPLETAFFIESEGNRPNVASLHRLIENDRNQHLSGCPN
jgi:S1-C subfamily serine protease